MHFAYPARKNSNAPPYAPRSSRLLPTVRRRHVKTIALFAIGIMALIWLLSGRSSSSGAGSRSRPGGPARRITGKPPAVLVTVFDEKTSTPEYIKNIKDNRIQYAAKHGYETFFATTTDYDLNQSPESWSKVVAARHSLAKFPDARFVWLLDQNAFLMNPRLAVEDLMDPKRLEATMLRERSVVPPDSIIKTHGNLKGGEVQVLMTQDKQGLAVGSFIVRNGEWAKFFLDTWFDPLYRSYNFQRAETHALEHVVQWHPTILSKMAIVPQRDINAYSDPNFGETYREGDVVVSFAQCTPAGDHSCDRESERYTQQWRTAFNKG